MHRILPRSTGMLAVEVRLETGQTSPRRGTATNALGNARQANWPLMTSSAVR